VCLVLSLTSILISLLLSLLSLRRLEGRIKLLARVGQCFLINARGSIRSGYVDSYAPVNPSQID